MAHAPKFDVYQHVTDEIIAQIEAGTRRSRFRTLDLAAIVARTGEIYAEVAADAGHALSCAPLEPLTIEGDEELLTQLLANLIENAIKHSPAGTLIHVSATDQADYVMISVEDSGPGISIEDQKHIFEPFYRSSSARSRGVHGTGLGLVIAARIAKHMRGEVTCDSAARNGSRFTVKIPAA